MFLRRLSFGLLPLCDHHSKLDLNPITQGSLIFFRCLAKFQQERLACSERDALCFLRLHGQSVGQCETGVKGKMQVGRK
jgi:hypothetical protein